MGAALQADGETGSPLYGPQASEGEAQHGLFCWTGRIGQGHERLHCRWRGKDYAGSKVASEPDALLAVLMNASHRFKRIGLEAGPLSQWLFSALAEAGLPVICVETRHMRAVLKAQINKTDRNDARGIAQMMRVGLYRPVHVKTLRSQKLRMLLTHRCRRRRLPSRTTCVAPCATSASRSEWSER